MKRLFTILSALSLIATACHREPYADAFITPNPAYVGEDIKFDNISINTDYVEWDMGDGTSSTAYNLKHYYIDPGTYTVTQRAFRDKGGVNVASHVVEVWGAELEIIVQEYYDIGAPEGALIPGASVMLYPTLSDWENFTNPVVQYIDGVAVTELFTNSIGKVVFDDLSYQSYYVDVWHQNWSNEPLAFEDVGWIETQMLEGAYYQTFIAFVDPVEFTMKSTSRPEGQLRKLEDAAPAQKRDLMINKISKPRK
ncbi:MAG: PKD domain-containing protein [Bacteroidota bacterium]